MSDHQHSYSFLRSDMQVKDVEGTNDPLLRSVDVFYCTVCLHYERKVTSIHYPSLGGEGTVEIKQVPEASPQTRKATLSHPTIQERNEAHAERQYEKRRG